MEIKIRHIDGVKFEAATRGHTLICDQPQASDAGMTPPELLLASLGTCAGYYAAQYLRNHHLSQEGLEVTVAAEKAAAPARIGSFRIDVHTPGLPPDHEAGLLRAVNACLIKNTLALPPALETVLHTAALTHA